MSAPDRAHGRVADKWAGEQAAAHYAAERFRTSSAARRDPGIVARLLAEHGVRAGARVLDAPCGAGRIAASLPPGACVVGLDANAPMVVQARRAAEGLLGVQGSALALPFAARSFDAVVCCRLLHHLRAPEELEQAVRELARVSRRLVLASFWDAGSWPALRVRLGLKRDEGPRGRAATSRARMAELFAAAGAPVIGFRAVLRFVSQQTFVVARRADAEG